MDLFIRRIIGFGVERADIDGVSVCRMFNAETRQHRPRPALPLPSLARQPARSRDRRDQVGSLRPGLTSLRRALDRNHPARTSIRYFSGTR